MFDEQSLFKEKWFSIAMVPESLIIFDYLTIPEPFGCIFQPSRQLVGSKLGWRLRNQTRRASDHVPSRRPGKAIFGGWRSIKFAIKSYFDYFGVFTMAPIDPIGWFGVDTAHIPGDELGRIKVNHGMVRVDPQTLAAFVHFLRSVA